MYIYIYTYIYVCIYIYKCTYTSTSNPCGECWIYACMLKCVAVYCSVLQRVAVCCGVLDICMCACIYACVTQRISQRVIFTLNLLCTMTVTLTFENLAPDKGEACRADNARELPSYRRSGEVQVRFPKNDDVAALIDRMALYVSKNGYCETQHTLQHAAARCNTLHRDVAALVDRMALYVSRIGAAQVCNTLQNTANRCNMM